MAPKDDDTTSDHPNHSFDIIDVDDNEQRKFEPLRVKVAISWDNICIKTRPIKGKCGKKVFTESRTILDGISGCAASGEFISILGASGAGKTTLLNHLSGRLLATNLDK